MIRSGDCVSSLAQEHLEEELLPQEQPSQAADRAGTATQQSMAPDQHSEQQLVKRGGGDKSGSVCSAAVQESFVAPVAADDHWIALALQRDLNRSSRRNAAR